MEVAERLVLNDGAITFTRGQRSSAIDVSLCSPSIVNRFNLLKKTLWVVITIQYSSTPTTNLKLFPVARAGSTIKQTGLNFKV